MTGRLLLLLALAFALSLSAGKVWIAPSDWLADSANGWIFLDLRLPRALLGLAIGAVLGLAGATMQGFLRNPLADPTVIGISSTAALGGVAALLAGFSPFPLAMLGAGASIFLLEAMAGRSESQLGFILAGMVLATLSGSLTAFLISIAPNPYATSEILAWMMGALTDRSWHDCLLALPPIAIGGGLLLLTGKGLDAMTLGSDTARSLGIDLARLRRLLALGVGLCVGASVAVAGIVGFVGLIVPHFARLLVGERPSAILWPSALCGAILLLAADSLVRLAPGAAEIRLGIAMSLIGAPFFLLLLARARRGAP